MSASAAYVYPVQTLLTDENCFDLHCIGRALSPIRPCAANKQALFKNYGIYRSLAMNMQRSGDYSCTPTKVIVFLLSEYHYFDLVLIALFYHGEQDR
jgi:hypothetical protein